MKKYDVGIIGNGFVGESQAFAFSPIADIKIYDVKLILHLLTFEKSKVFSHSFFNFF